MTKAELVERIAREARFQATDVKRVVQMVLDTMIEGLSEDGRVELRNFGIFDIRVRKPRKGRNPRTGEAVDVPVRKRVKFKPGKEMIDKCISTSASSDPIDHNRSPDPESDSPAPSSAGSPAASDGPTPS